MRPHIIAGFDGSPGSLDALALALVLLDSEPECAAELTVVSVAAADVYGAHPTRSHATYERALAGEARARLDGAREIVGTRPSVSFAVRPDSTPARALHLLARQYSASAVVVGRSHAGLVGRAFEGSVTEQTLHGSPCPVYVAPVGYADRDAQHRLEAIAVGFDGSATSLSALAFAAGLAARHGATLRVIRVLEPRTGHRLGDDTGAESLADRAAALADLRLHSAHIDGVTIELVVVVGDPVSVLGSPGPDTDLLVVGSRDFGPLEAVLLGGVSSRLVRDSTAPVVVVPRAPTPAPDTTGARSIAAMR